MLFISSASLGTIDIVSSIVYAVVMPYVSIVLALLFFDLRATSDPMPATAEPDAAA